MSDAILINLGDAQISDLISTSREILKEIIKVGHRLPQKIVCILPASVCVAKTLVVEKKGKTPSVCSEKLLKNLVENDSLDRPEGEILEDEIIDLSLNGYHVAQPVGQLAQELEIKHYVSAVDPKILKELRQAFSSAAPRVEIEFRSWPLVFFQTLGRLYPDSCGNYLALRFGDEFSDLSLVWRGSLLGTRSFPEAGTWLIKKLSEAWQTTRAEASSTLRSYSAGKVNSATQSSIEKSLSKIKTEWFAAFRETLDVLLDNSFLPNRIFVWGEAGMTGVVKKWLEEEGWHNVVDVCDTIKENNLLNFYVSRH